jgi:hypothetical protein
MTTAKGGGFLSLNKNDFIRPIYAEKQYRKAVARSVLV